MSLPDDIFESVLAKMIVETESTEQQKKAKEVLERIDALASNIFFIGIVVTFVTYVSIKFFGNHPGLMASLDSMRQKVSYPVLGLGCLGTIALFLLILRGLLYVFRIVSATELTKFYLFVELINLAVQYLYHPQEGPTPMLFEMLRKILDISRGVRGRL